MYRLSNDEKGVSEVISALLIILIAVAIGLGLYSYSINVFGIAKSNFLLEAQVGKETVEERFVNMAAWNDTDSIYFTIFNYGKSEVTIAAVYMNGSSIGEDDLLFEGGDPTIKINEVKWVKASDNWGIDPQMSKIVVSSTKGNTIEFEFKWS